MLVYHGMHTTVFDGLATFLAFLAFLLRTDI